MSRVASVRRQIQEQARTQVGRRVAGAVGTRRLDELERTGAGLVERRRGPAPGGAGGGVGA